MRLHERVLRPCSLAKYAAAFLGCHAPRSAGAGTAFDKEDTHWLGACALVVGGCGVAQGRVLALMVVEVDVTADSDVQILVGHERASAIQVGLHRLVPGVHVRVVAHAVGPADRLREACTTQLALCANETI